MIAWPKIDIVGLDTKISVSCRPKGKARGLFLGRQGHLFSQIIGRPPFGLSENLGSAVGNTPLSLG